MLLITSGLVAYAQVFVATVAPFLARAPGDGGGDDDDVARGRAVALYSAVVLPLSCLDLAEQVGAQVAMAAMRFVALGVMMRLMAREATEDEKHSKTSSAEGANTKALIGVCEEVLSPILRDDEAECPLRRAFETSTGSSSSDGRVPLAAETASIAALGKTLKNLHV